MCKSNFTWIASNLTVMLVGAVVGARVGSPGNGVGCNEEGEQEGLQVGIGEEEGAAQVVQALDIAEVWSIHLRG